MSHLVKQLSDAADIGFKRCREDTLGNDVKSLLYDVANKALDVALSTKDLKEEQISNNWIDQDTQTNIIKFLGYSVRKDDYDPEWLAVLTNAKATFNKLQRELLLKNLADQSDEEQDDDFDIELEELIELFNASISKTNKHISKSTRQKVVKFLKTLAELRKENKHGKMHYD